VVFFDPKMKILSKKTFKITKLTMLYQGWGSLILKAIKEDFTEDQRYFGDVLIIDQGRKTVDITYNRNLTSVKGFSYDDSGMESLYLLIREKIQSEYQIKKKTFEIEKMILSGKSFFTSDGREINPNKYFKECLMIIADRIRNNILEDFIDNTFDSILLTGGGSIFFKDIMKQIYANCEVIENPMYANAIGMCRYVAFVLKK
jgi:plasmid segregation protein ParM